MKQVRATVKYIRLSPRKARLVADVVRGKSLDRSLNALGMLPQKGARIIEKLLLSASANAENNHDMNKESLKVKDIAVSGGPILYRFRPRARGRAYRIRKRSCHIAVVLEGE